MTRIELTHLNGGCVLECRGHAGYAPPGRDIVCAGISALCIALAARLETLADEGVLRIEQQHVSDGEYCVEAAFAEDGCARLIAESAVETAAGGFRALAELYPAYVAMEEN